RRTDRHRETTRGAAPSRPAPLTVRCSPPEAVLPPYTESARSIVTLTCDATFTPAVATLMFIPLGTRSTAWGPDECPEGTVMSKSANQIVVGDRITYLAGTPVGMEKLFRNGKVVAFPISDPYTSVLWFPTRPDDADDETEPVWVRHDKVVDVVPAN